MEEQNTVPKRPIEDAVPKKKATPKAKATSKKKKKDEIVATQSPPSLPPPPPEGAAALRATEEPDTEPASASSANAPTSVPHYRQKEGSAPSGYRKKPPPGGEMIDDLPAVPVKRKGEKPLEEGIPDALRPERQRPRAPLAEPDPEANPMQASSSSSSSSRRLANRNPLRV
jgi:hypothetical protein